MSVTLKDIARRVGKSVTTVSRALNDYDDVGPATKAEIIQIAQEMGYSPNTLAQRLQKRRTDTIGLIIPNTSNTSLLDPFFTKFLAAIGNTAREYGYDILVSTQPSVEDELKAYRKMLEGRQVDGFIVARTRRIDQRIDYLIQHDFPFVSFGRVENRDNFLFIDVDGEYGMELVVKHLIKLGHRRIAMIAPDPDFMFAITRISGVRNTLSQNNIDLPDKYLRIGELDQESGYWQARSLLDLPKPPTAIVAGNDLMAFGAFRAVQEMGLIVGHDISITGFDDIPMAEHSNPPLTTLHQPFEKIGGLVCDMLIKVIQGRALEQKKLVLKPGLVIRQSSGKSNEDIGIMKGGVAI